MAMAGGKRHSFAIGKSSEAEAAANSAQVEYRLLRHERRLIELPHGVDIVEFMPSDPGSPAHDAAIHCLPRLTPAAFRDRARETRLGSLEANTLQTAEMHFKHRARILGVFPIRELKLPGLRGDAITGMDRPTLDIRTDMLYEWCRCSSTPLGPKRRCASKSSSITPFA